MGVVKGLFKSCDFWHNYGIGQLELLCNADPLVGQQAWKRMRSNFEKFTTNANLDKVQRKRIGPNEEFDAGDEGARGHPSATEDNEFKTSASRKEPTEEDLTRHEDEAATLRRIPSANHPLGSSALMKRKTSKR
ncbi:unnamed protein product [Angiostrongylus costaricensis]|uniref:NAM-associated domain-containing protein n=1 Tax=Angiostrongylus costaricensis TaxID=334426 RepID=A0A0R3PZU5_ANGCS|nr:unnamed protein product [Angiostrongylus costaricensis]